MSVPSETQIPEYTNLTRADPLGPINGIGISVDSSGNGISLYKRPRPLILYLQKPPEPPVRWMVCVR